jgi:hypothetical protein
MPKAARPDVNLAAGLDEALEKSVGRLVGALDPSNLDEDEPPRVVGRDSKQAAILPL